MSDSSREHEFTASGWPAGEEPPEHVKEVLRRTVQFLARCAQDPRDALESEDPGDLIEGLEKILHDTPSEASPRTTDTRDTPPSIHRRRRSA